MLVRLADRLLVSKGVRFTDAGDRDELQTWSRVWSDTRKAMPVVPRIIIDGVASGFLESRAYRRAGGDLYFNPTTAYELCSNVAPPFQHFWLEWLNPIKSSNVSIYGMSVYALEPPEVPDGVRWRLNLLPCGWTGDEIAATFSGYQVDVCADGSLCDAIGVYGSGRSAENLVRSINEIAYPALYGLTVLNCRNVAIGDAPTAPEKFAHAYAKRRGQSLLRYHTLVISPSPKSIGVLSGKEGSPQAVHVVRGHFVHYGEGRGLFGKYHGTYWREAHMRGNPRLGLVTKDYRVETPGEN